MPFTPFHLGPALFFGLLFFRYVNPATFLIASVVVDVEPFFVLFLGLDYPLHGFFHSLPGGSIVAVILSFLMVFVLKPGQNISTKSIWLASFAGICLHILLDSTLYTDIKPFYPSSFNPFYSRSMFIGFGVYAVCVLMFFAGFLVYVYRLMGSRK